MVPGTRRVFLSLLLSLVWMVSGAHTVCARPEYARKEGKACQYCHLSGSPNTLNPDTGKREPTTRNARGMYYQTHDHSFSGYTEPTVSIKQGPALYHFVWKEDLQDLPRRMAVADMKGDGRVRLVTLNEKPDHKEVGMLTIKRWDGKAFVTEFSGDVQAPPDKMEVGRFAGADRPVVIVTADALWYWNGKTFVRKPSDHPLPLLGSVRLKEGGDRLILAESPTDIKAYRVNTNAPGGTWLGAGAAVPATDQLTGESFQNTTEFFDKMGMPALVAGGGLFGLWELPKAGMLLQYVHLDQDFDVINDPKDFKKTKFVLKNQYSYVLFRNPFQENAADLWTTPRLNGAVYDVAHDDPRGAGKPGLLLLTSEAASGKGRTIYFFTLD
jgi:hypothetical protein